jgi:hypothetical protein
MLPISAQPDMNSRATQQRSHRSRIRSPVVSKWSSLAEPTDQAAQRRIGHRFIPVIKDRVERSLAPHGAYDGAEDRRHPQQRRKASAEANAAKRCEENQNDHAQTEANDHLGRCQLLRKVRKLRQDWKPSTVRLARLLGRGTSRSKPRHQFIPGVTRNYRPGPVRRASSRRAVRRGRWSCSTAQ